MHFPKWEEPGLSSPRAQPRELLRGALSLSSRPGVLGLATAGHPLLPAPQHSDSSALAPWPSPSHTLQL